MELNKVEEGIVPIYENERKEKLISARELHDVLQSKRDFTTWIKGRIEKYEFKENEDFIVTFTKIGERKNVVRHDYYLTIDTGKELCMIENNDKGRRVRKYFIETEKRYRNYYKIQYVRNTKNGKRGEVKERGYKIEDVCYKVK